MQDSFQRMLELVRGLPAAAFQEPDSKRARVEGARTLSPSSNASVAAAFHEACGPFRPNKLRLAS